MDLATRTRMKRALSCCYNAIGYDAWGNSTPSDANFVDVIQDQIRNHVAYGCDQCFASVEDVDEFFTLLSTEQRKMILEVGP